jgi:hypothetical protein
MNGNTKTVIFATNGRGVGRVVGDTFKKRFKFSTGALHHPPALAFDMDSLKQAELAGAISIEVVDKETGRTFEAPLSLVWSKGFELNRGFGEQRALPMKYFHVKGEPAQLCLFGGAV